MRAVLFITLCIAAMPALSGPPCPAVMKQGGIFGEASVPVESVVKGSYADSCKDCATKAQHSGVLPAWHLSATCQDKEGKWRPTTLSNASLCKPGSVTNDDGRLRCDCIGQFSVEGGPSVRARLFLKGKNYFCEFK